MHVTSVHFALTTYRLLLELHSYSSRPFLCTLVMCMHVHLCACMYICVHVHMRHCVCVCVYHVYACVNVSWDCADKFVYTVVPLSISVCVVLTPDIVVLTCLGQSSFSSTSIDLLESHITSTLLTEQGMINFMLRQSFCLPPTIEARLTTHTYTKHLFLVFLGYSLLSRSGRKDTH